MGYYINPKNESKESFLTKHGKRIQPQFLDKSTGKFSICLVDNGFFTAAGVCFNEREFNDFNYNDGREKIWFEVDIDKLIDVVDGIEHII